jgi:predicted nucleic acid-binding protein
VNPFADASFIVAAFAPDEHTKRAWRWWRKTNAAVMNTRLALFEAENAIRSLPLGKKCSASEAKKALDGIKRALLEGLLVRREVPILRLYPTAQRLSQHHSNRVSYGAMDVLLVACALELQADTLLTFDERQGELAKAEGLKVQP